MGDLGVIGFCATSALMTAAICWYASAIGGTAHLIDRPDGVRKLHIRETPLVGGLATLLPSFAVSLVYLLGFALLLGRLCLSYIFGSGTMAPAVWFNG
jgi:UDP-N-acetylmuramyl pentapeptide phosphotransferase/UDP-N-acetylglucosamine-1-phosphate transferase